MGVSTELGGGGYVALLATWISLFVYAVYMSRAFVMLVRKETHGVMSFSWLLLSMFIIFLVMKMEYVKEGVKSLLPQKLWVQYVDAAYYYDTFIYVVLCALICNFSRAACVIRELDKGVFAGYPKWEKRLTESGLCLRVWEKLLRFLCSVFFALFIAAFVKFSLIDDENFNKSVVDVFAADRSALTDHTTAIDRQAVEYRKVVMPLALAALLFYVANGFWSYVVRKLVTRRTQVTQGIIIVTGITISFCLIMFSGGGPALLGYLVDVYNNLPASGLYAFVNAKPHGQQPDVIFVTVLSGVAIVMAVATIWACCWDSARTLCRGIVTLKRMGLMSTLGWVGRVVFSMIQCMKPALRPDMDHAGHRASD